MGFEKFKHKKKCGKRRFRNEFEARRHAQLYGLRAYPCQICNGWHLTSQDRRS